MTEEALIKVAVAGNPNAGKSSLINAIAGSRLQVGNWPGVTVERKEAFFDLYGQKVQLIDLPGTYSLSPYSEEEVVARDYLLHEKPDLIINVIDSTNFERNLFLTIQLLELGIPVVLVLNMFDELEQKGFTVNQAAIEKILQVKVISTVANKKKGIKDLLDAIVDVASHPENYQPKELYYSSDLEEAAAILIDNLKDHYPKYCEEYPKKWLAYKVLEKDSYIQEHLKLDYDKLMDHPIIHHLQKGHGHDLEQLMSEMRHAKAMGLTQEVMKRPLIQKVELTEHIDRFVLNRYLSIPIFMGIVWFMFKLTFDVATPFVDWIDGVFSGPLTRWTTLLLHSIGAPDWVESLIVEGIIGGVGFVLVFVPVIFTMMFFITFLEGCGYMARAAFVMDRYMHLIGLHGKSFIPLLLGFGCNVPGVYATRTLENRRDRELTALILPMMTCGARLPVYILFVGIFFVESSGTVLFSMYLLGILMAVLVGLVFKRTLFKGEVPIFIMELPPYRMPSMENLLIHTWEKAKHFLIKAGTTILAMSVIIWFSLNLPWGVESQKESFLGQVSQVVSPVFEPIGFGSWQSSAALITGIMAKEIIITTMAEIYSSDAVEETVEDVTVSEEIKEIFTSFFSAVKTSILNIFGTAGIASITTEESDQSRSLRGVIQKNFTPLSAYSFMAFVLLYMPCLVTGLAMKQEFGSWKLFWIATAYGLVLAWVTSFIIYQGGLFLNIGV